MSETQKNNAKKGVQGQVYVLHPDEGECFDNVSSLHDFNGVNLIRAWVGATLPFYNGKVEQPKDMPNNEYVVTTNAPALKMFLDSRAVGDKKSTTLALTHS